VSRGVHDPPRVLIVDDNENNRAILAARLGAQGYSTEEACDGAEALEVARSDAPDLILLDVTMPRMDGLEACRRLRSDPSVGFVPIILVTARADSKDVVAGLEAGADEYLTKPVDQQALVARVRSMLRVKELHDRTKQQAAELAAWNESLERRVAEQVIQIERASRSPYGGQLTENVVSALSRELLVHAMFALEAAGLPIVFTVHDEIVVEHPDITKETMQRIMSARPPWAEKLNIPVKAKAWIGKRYRK
jgi:adenylate cyclase